MPVLVGRSLSEITLAARAQGPPLLVTLDESGSITAYDALLAKTPLATLDGATLLGEKPLALEAEANQRVLRLRGASNQLLVAGVEDMTGGKRQVLVPLGESCTTCALGAAEQHGASSSASAAGTSAMAVRHTEQRPKQSSFRVGERQAEPRSRPVRHAAGAMGLSRHLLVSG